MTIRKLQT